MKNQRLVLTLGVLILTSLLVSCKGKTKNFYDDYSDDYVKHGYENPIDSIVNTVDNKDCFTEVYKFLSSNSDFITNSQSVGYCTTDCFTFKAWIGCDNIRVYSIPVEMDCENSLFCKHIGQFGNVLDTISFNNDLEYLEALQNTKTKDGKEYYLLKTTSETMHQGMVHSENIKAFSVKNGMLYKEKIFHTNNAEYDQIELSCGGQRWLPLDFEEINLIALPSMSDNEEPTTIIIAEINENAWPTGYGLKYVWDGTCFNYSGKCKYDANQLLGD